MAQATSVNYAISKRTETAACADCGEDFERMRKSAAHQATTRCAVCREKLKTAKQRTRRAWAVNDNGGRPAAADREAARSIGHCSRCSGPMPKRAKTSAQLELCPACSLKSWPMVEYRRSR